MALQGHLEVKQSLTGKIHRLGYNEIQALAAEMDVAITATEEATARAKEAAEVVLTEFNTITKDSGVFTQVESGIYYNNVGERTEHTKYTSYHLIAEEDFDFFFEGVMELRDQTEISTGSLYATVFSNGVASRENARVTEHFSTEGYTTEFPWKMGMSITVKAGELFVISFPDDFYYYNGIEFVKGFSCRTTYGEAGVVMADRVQFGKKQVAEIKKLGLEVFRETANAVKGFASGSAVSLADVSPIDHTLFVKIRSKNLLPIADGVSVSNGVTFTRNSDGSVSAKGTATAFASAKLGDVTLKGGRYYTISGSKGGSRSQYQLYTTGNIAFYEGSAATKYVEADTTVSLCAVVYQGNTVDGVIFKPQIEEGQSATEFSAFADVSKVSLLVNDEVFTPENDGTVQGVKSVYPSMRLSVEGYGVAVDVEYSRDLNKVYSALLKAITALGGTVDSFVEETPVLNQTALNITTTCFVDSGYSSISLYINGEKQYTTPMYGNSSANIVYSNTFENVTEAYIVFEGSMNGSAHTTVNGVKIWQAEDVVGTRYDLLALNTDTINIRTDFNY